MGTLKGGTTIVIKTELTIANKVEKKLSVKNLAQFNGSNRKMKKATTNKYYQFINKPVTCPMVFVK